MFKFKVEDAMKALSIQCLELGQFPQQPGQVVWTCLFGDTRGNVVFEARNQMGLEILYPLGLLQAMSICKRGRTECDMSKNISNIYRNSGTKAIVGDSFTDLQSQSTHLIKDFYQICHNLTVTLQTFLTFSLACISMSTILFEYAFTDFILTQVNM